MLNILFQVLKKKNIFKKQVVFLLATTFSGILVSDYTKATILENNYKEVIDHVWQIVYRDFLDSSGKFEKSNWINIRKDFLAKNYSDSNEAYDAIRNMLLKLDGFIIEDNLFNCVMSSSFNFRFNFFNFTSDLIRETKLINTLIFFAGI